MALKQGGVTILWCPGALPPSVPLSSEQCGFASWIFHAEILSYLYSLLAAPFADRRVSAQKLQLEVGAN